MMKISQKKNNKISVYQIWNNSHLLSHSPLSNTSFLLQFVPSFKVKVFIMYIPFCSAIWNSYLLLFRVYSIRKDFVPVGER